jgi:hypothetical protein
MACRADQAARYWRGGRVRNVGISAGYGVFPQTIAGGQVIGFDRATAGAMLQSAIGAGSLRPCVSGQDDVGHSGLAN